MIDTWQPNPAHYKILGELFAGFDKNIKYNILDAGSGRTSLTFLQQFPKSSVVAVVYLGDNRKLLGIEESVDTENFDINVIEADLHEIRQDKKYDIVLAHLLLGEATKFSDLGFGKMLDTLFSIETDYLVIVDIENDPKVDYELLDKYMHESGTIERTVREDKYIGYLIKKN